ELVGDLEQVDVVRLHQRVDLAEGEELVAAVEAQHREHRLRPEHPAARRAPASLMSSPSGGGGDCQWKAKRRIRTTKPVVADSVTESAASEPQIGSLCSRVRGARARRDLIGPGGT